MFYIFESQKRRVSDERKLRDISMRYGEQALEVLRVRANDDALADRDRKHWARLARKMPSFQRSESASNRAGMLTNSH